LQNNDALESDYDLLSIDIDGNDYWILDSLKSLRPKVIVIEYNSTIPLGVEFTQPKNSQVNFGSSAESLMHLANSKGYDLCYMTSSNLFFVRKDVSTLLTSPHFQFRNQIHRIWQNPPSPIYLFSAIDGTVLISDNLFLNWHRVLVKQNDLQKLPRFLRKPTGDYNLFLMMIFRLRYKLKTDLGRFFRNHLSPKNFEMLKRVFTEKIDAFLQNLQ
jgi:hypothetical protein